MEARTLMKKAPVDWRKAVDRIPTEDRDKLRRELEEIAERAAMLAGYLDERHGYGCGDRGHKLALKHANRIGKLIWMKGFGYNSHHGLRI